MRYAILFAVVVAALFALPAQACESCYEYFDYQSQEFCSYCSGSHCGWFNCHVQYYAGLGGDYCTGDDSGCFSYGENCAEEPQVDMPKLHDRWQLANVRIVRSSPIPDKKG